MKRALVTGGAGFIGSHLVEVLLSKDYDVYVIDNFMNGRREHVSMLPKENVLEIDIRDRARMTSAISALAPHSAFHLAAIHFIPYCNEHPTEAVLINVQGTQNVLDALRNAPSVEKLFFASTAAVYPAAESAHVETDQEDPIDIYGATKCAGESLVRAFSASTGVPTVIGRLFNAVGLRETNPHLLPEIVQQLRGGSRTLRLGNLDPKRDFIDARDMAQAILAAVTLWQRGCDVFNIGAGRQYSVLDVVAICERIFGEKIEVIQEASRVRKVERPSLLAGIGKLSKASGWTPQIDLEATLRDLLMR